MRKLIVLFCLLPLFSLAQQEGNIWYFGQMLGLDFSSGTPVPLTDGAIETVEGSASYSDSDGNLLFYTNGGGRDPIASGQPPGIIWNRNHEVMYDMSFTEGGGWSAAQSALVTPKPGSSDVYYLFTMEESEFETGGAVVGQPQGRGLSYFEIDMSLNGGLGAVTVADERIYVPTFEGLSGTIHADGDKYWIVAYQYDQNVSQFITVLIDEDGIQQQDISLQAVGFDYELYAPIKISPNSQWLTCGGWLFEFDNQTGEITNLEYQFESQPSVVSFTADSRYLYYQSSELELIRLDVTAADIDASAEQVGGTNPFEGFIGQMQLAPNGNLYFTQYAGTAADVPINEVACPSSAEPQVNYGLFLYSSTPSDLSFFGLPNFTDHLFRRDPGVNPLSTEGVVLCEGESVVLRARLPGSSYQWNTGETTDSLVVSEPGVYILTIVDNCGESILDRKVVSVEPLASVSLGEIPSELCEGDTVLLSATAMNAESLTWSTGDTTATISVLLSDTYTVTATNGCGEAVAEASLMFEDCNPEIECGLALPNIITPNQDGTNDRFGGFTNCLPIDYQLQIYSRWGQLIFESEDPNQFWTGEYNGKPAPAEVYIYRMVYRFTEEEEITEKSGDLTLVR